MTKNMLKTRRMMVGNPTMTGKRLVNDSRTARKWLDKVGHFLAVLLVLLTIGIGNAWGATLTYTHDFTAKPDIGDNTLSSITWTVAATNLNGMNTANYKGVQFGSGSKDGSITLTSKNNWGAQTSTTYYGYTNVKKVYVWLNKGGGTTTASVTVGGTAATSDGTTVVKNSSATSQRNGTTKITFTPAAGHTTGTIVISCTSSGAAGYICSIQVECEQPDCSTLSAPGSLSSTPSATSVDLSWSSVASSSGYVVTFDGVNYNIASGTTTKTITGLKKEKTYAWTVAAKGDGSTYCELGTPTSEQSVTTLDGCSDDKVTYTVATTSSVTSSDAPDGTSATYSSTYTTACQLTADKSMTLTLSGYAGKTIKGLTLDMKSNNTTGAGTFSLVIGSTTVASISSATDFDEWYDNDAFGNTYRKVHVTLSDEVTVGADEDIVITIAATANSLYCQAFTLCYESCDPLGTIDGSVSLAQLATPDPTKLKATWSMNATTGIASYNLEVYNSSDVKVKTINDYTSGDEITGLTPCTTYYVKLYTVSSGGDYCDGGLIGTSSTCTTNGYSVNYSGCSNVSQSGATSVCGSEALSVTFSPSSVAYVLPDNVSVTIGGNAATVVTDYTWTKATGVLSIPAAKQTGNIVIDVDGVFVGCSVDPTVTNENLQLDGSGTFSLEQVDVKTSGWSVGSNTCEWTDYGFVWGTSANPTVGGSGCTQVQVGTSGNASSWSGSLEGDFETGTTYYYRAYAKNSKSEAAYVYSSSDGTFTPYEISYNKNDDDATGTVATQVVNGGSSITLPAASAYTLNCNDLTKWALNSASGTQYDPEATYSSISADAEFYAIWTTRTYTVSYAAGTTPTNGGTITGSHDDDTKTCGVKFTLPGVTFYSTGYTQDGWSKADGGTKTNNLGGTYNPSEANEKDQTFYPHWLINTYTISKGTATGCSGGDFTLSATSVDHYGSITVTASADATHKGSPIVTISPSGNGSVSGTTISNITGNITVSVSFAEKETASIILHDADGQTTVSGTHYEMDNYTLPNTAAACTESELYGWYTETYVNQPTAPSGAKFIAKNASKVLTAGENHFYAVYATVDDRYTNTYTKITSVDDLTSGDYLIAGISSWCMSNSVSSDHMTESSMSSYLSDGVITNTSNNDIIWTITKNGDNYTLYNAAAEKYLALTTTSPAIQDDAHNFTVALDGTCWVFSSVATTGYKLVYSGYFKSLTEKSSDVLLYKRGKATSAGAPYTTSPNCTTHDLTSVIDPSSPVSGTIELGKETIVEGKTTTATATPSEHYTFSHWTISGTGSTMSNTSDGKSTDNPVTITMGTADTEITAHFTEKEKCTVVFKNNNGVVSSTTYWLSEVPEAPTLKDGTTDGGKAFVGTSETHYGWTHTAWENTLTQDQVNAKTDDNDTVYTKDATLPAITAGDDGTTITYHAVWAHKATNSVSKNFTLSIAYGDCPASYSSSLSNITANEVGGTGTLSVSFGGTGVMNQSSKIQFRKSSNGAGYIYNTNDLGSITGITTGNNSLLYNIGTSENPSSGSSGGYFKIYNSTDNAKTTDGITVNFTKTITTTSYSAFRTTGPMTFTAATDGNWNTATNWTGGFVPTIENDVVIAKPATVDITNAVAKSIVIDQSSTNTGKLTIPAGNGLVVAGTVKKTTDGSTLSATEVDDLEFGSTLAAGTGALVMGNHNGTNQATVQFATKAYKNGEYYVNQYIGTPFNDETNILYNYYNSWIYAITYQDGVPGWNDRVDKGEGLNPFEGYDLMRPETTQNVVLSMEGTLVSSDDVTLTSSTTPALTYNGSSNTENVLANSWMAPIKIKAFEASDFTNMEATIYIFNAGSTDDVGKEGPAGNYSTYPIDKADATDVIPSMQSFSVYATAASPSLKLDYSKLVYDPAVAGLAVQPNYAPRRAKAEAMTSLKLHVAGESGFADELKVYVHEDFDEGFENGWDGHKMYGLDEAPQLYVVTNDGNMAVNCVPDAESMLIGLKAGTKDEQYTMTFEYDDAEPLYMVDTKTNTYTQVMTGNEYTFQTNDLGAHSRFILTHYAPQMPTDLEPTSDSSLKGRERGLKFIEGEKMFILMNGVLYDATGRRVEGVRE